MPSGDGSATKVGNGTWVQWTVVLALIGGAVSFTWSARGFSKDLTSALVLLSSINERVEDVEKAVTGVQFAVRDVWTGTDMKLWTSELALQNPSVSVPPVRRAVDDTR